MPLPSRLRSILQPKIKTDRELVIHVVRVVILCVVAAVALDVVNQLTFFIDWETSLRS